MGKEAGIAEKTEGFEELNQYIDNLSKQAGTPVLRDGGAVFLHGSEATSLHGSEATSLIPILHYAQKLYGYLSREVQTHIAERLGIPVSKVYGVVTFYSYFSTERKGKYKINVCMGTACFVRGAEAVTKEFEKELSIGVTETTPDGMFTLDTIRCVGACGLAPVVMVNDKVYGRVKPEEVKGIVDEYLMC